MKTQREWVFFATQHDGVSFTHKIKKCVRPERTREWGYLTKHVLGLPNVYSVSYKLND